MIKKLEKYEGPPRWGCCWGDYRCKDDIAYILTLYGREYPMCKRHKKVIPLKGKRKKEARLAWIKFLRMQRRGKVRYPRTTGRRLICIQRLVRYTARHADEITKKDLRRIFGKWCEMQDRDADQNMMDKFIERIRKTRKRRK